MGRMARPKNTSTTHSPLRIKSRLPSSGLFACPRPPHGWAQLFPAVPLAQAHKDGAGFLLLLLFPLLPLIPDQQPDPTHPDELHCLFIVAWIAGGCKPGNAWHTGHVPSDWKGVPRSASVM